MNKLIETIIDIATTDVEPISSDISILKAIGLMETNKYHNLIVEKEGDIYFVTMHDLLRSHSVNQHIDSLIYKPYCVNENTPIMDAVYNILSSGQRSAPVIDDKGNLKGIVTDYDVLKYVSELDFFKNIVIKKIMTKNPIILHKDDSIGKVRSTMSKQGIGRIIIVDEEELPIGIVTENDILKKIYKPKKKMTVGELAGEKVPRMAQPVSMIMNTTLITATIEDSIATIANLMKSHNIRSIPLVKNNILKGIITRLDILKYIKSLKEESTIEVEINGVFDEEHRELAERILDTEIKKIARNSKRIHWIKVSIKKVHDKGGVPAYNVKVYVKTPKKLYVSEGRPKVSEKTKINLEGEEIRLISEKQRWDFIEVLKDALESVKKQIGSDKSRWNDR